MEESISLREIFQVIKRKWILIVSIMIIAATASGVISYTILSPVYQTSTQFLVNQTDAENPSQKNLQDIQSDLQVINTYNVIIKSPVILEDVIKELDLDIDEEELQSKITVSSEQDSQVVTLAVRDGNPKKAVDIADKTMKVFESKIKELMNIDNIHVLSYADQPSSPIKPKPTINIAIALVVGAMIGVGLAIILHYLDNTIKNESDVDQTLQVPLLGVISEMKKSDAMNTNERR